jgi:hypothetical protein
LAGIPSAPVAILMLILFIIFSTLFVVTFSKTNLFVQSFCFFISIKLEKVVKIMTFKNAVGNN